MSEQRDFFCSQKATKKSFILFLFLLGKSTDIFIHRILYTKIESVQARGCIRIVNMIIVL